MANTGKKIAPGTTDAEMREKMDLLIKISSLPKKVQLRLHLTPKQASILLGRRIATLEKDRKTRDTAPSKPAIDQRSYASLPYIQPTPDEREIQYRAYDILDLLDRRTGGPAGKALARGMPSPEDAKVRGFESWLSYGSASDDWPFCIQQDGRPMPMAQAIATGCLTDDSVRLNIREYSEQVADAASKAYAAEAKKAVEKSSGKSKKKTKKKDRWNEPSGPI